MHEWLPVAAHGIVSPVTIARLSDHLVNLIAAGEVVERPAAVVRELIDNSLDAGARRITVSIVDGGLELIAVTDDGAGIPPSEAALAFERHATSKLRDPSDLEAITTLGFRGEALASIASVARVKMVTRTVDEPLATEVTIVGGRDQSIRAVPGPRGTTIEVAQLFFNQPARKKFMKQPRTELARIRAHLRAVSLVAPQVHFILRADGEELDNLPPVQQFHERARAALADREQHLLSFKEVGEVFVIEGLVTDPGYPAKQAPVMLVNGHVVQDRMLLRAVRDGYGGMLKNFEQPGGCLVVSIRPDLIDVNVHPQKSEVRFRDGSAVFVAVRNAVQRALEKGLSATIRVDINLSTAPSSTSGQPSGDVSGAVAQGRADEAVGSEAADSAANSNRPTVFAHQTRIPLRSFGISVGSNAMRANFPDLAEPSPPYLAQENSFPQGRERQPEYLASPNFAAPDLASSNLGVSSHSVRLIGQVLGCYLLGEDTRTEELICVDMHAAHERVNYNRIRGQLSERTLPSQELLIPERIALSGESLDVLEARRDEFAAFGFRFELAVGSAVSLMAAPAFVSPKRAVPLFRETVNLCVAHDFAKPFDILLDQFAARLACHASVRGGDTVSIAEGYALLDALLDAETSGACPHGRPVMRRFPRGAVERWFGRDR